MDGAKEPADVHKKFKITVKNTIVLILVPQILSVVSLLMVINKDVLPCPWKDSLSINVFHKFFVVRQWNLKVLKCHIIALTKVPR